MNRVVIVMGVATFALMGSCLAAEHGTARIKGTKPDSPLSGTATFTPAGDGLRVSVQVKHAPPGTHGIHIHEHGSCDDSGNAAGGHYNPDGSHHGFLPKDHFTGAHAGDFGNIKVGPNGTGHLTLTLPGLTLGGKSHDVLGHAVILHEKADDFGQPTGNAGARIGCGVITAN